MKKILVFASMLFLISFTTNSCQDKCENVVCSNGTCNEGNCECDYGWESSDCSTKKAAYLYGDWTGEFTCITNTDTITMKIEEIESSVDILKMHTVGLTFDFNSIPVSFDSFSFIGIVDSTFNAFTIDPLTIKQTVPFNGNNIELEVLVSGSGTKNTNDNLDFILDFKIINIGQTFTCNGELEK